MQVFLKEKHSLKHIFSKIAAKTRNVGIRESLHPFIGIYWRQFKFVYRALRESELMRM